MCIYKFSSILYNNIKKGGFIMSKNHKNEITEENLQDVSGGIGMANPYDTPEKKQAYQDYKDGKIDVKQLVGKLGIKRPKTPRIR